MELVTDAVALHEGDHLRVLVNGEQGTWVDVRMKDGQLHIETLNVAPAIQRFGR